MGIATSKIRSNYIGNGISLSPSVPTSGESIKISYNGLLSKSGAHSMYARVGYGSNFAKFADYPMQKTTSGFETTIAIKGSSESLNMCFKDCAGNWDNNSGNNYVFEIE